MTIDKNKILFLCHIDGHVDCPDVPFLDYYGLLFGRRGTIKMVVVGVVCYEFVVCKGGVECGGMKAVEEEEEEYHLGQILFFFPTYVFGFFYILVVVVMV